MISKCRQCGVLALSPSLQSLWFSPNNLKIVQFSSVWLIVVRDRKICMSLELQGRVMIFQKGQNFCSAARSSDPAGTAPVRFGLLCKQCSKGVKEAASYARRGLCDLQPELYVAGCLCFLSIVQKLRNHVVHFANLLNNSLPKSCCQMLQLFRIVWQRFK